MLILTLHQSWDLLTGCEDWSEQSACMSAGLCQYKSWIVDSSKMYVLYLNQNSLSQLSFGSLYCTQYVFVGVINNH